MHKGTMDEPLSQPPSIYEHDSMQDLCEMCRTRSWVDLKEDLEHYQMLKKDLKPSECRICRLLWNTLPLEGHADGRGLHVKREAIPISSEHSSGPMEATCIHGPSLASESWRNYCVDPYIFVSTSNIEHKRILTELERLYSPLVDFEMVKKWITDCDSKHHKPCVLQYRPELQDLRVIDCQERRVVNWTGERHFVALSYVWGELSSPDASVHDGLGPWQLLPKTIQQSIQVTLGLGYRFLWVDRYCIRQTDLEDTKKQIDQMANIYLTANLTIIAAAGEDPSHGLPGVPPTFRPSISYEMIGSACLYALPSILGTSKVWESKWASRAWTYQECFFARRRLIFTDRQVIFLCNTKTNYEATPVVNIRESSVRRPEETDYRADSLTPRRYNECNVARVHRRPLHKSSAALKVSLYSERSLRYDEDALSAISGTLNLLAVEQIYHIWGLLFCFDPNQIHSPNIHDEEVRGEILLAWDIDGVCRRRKCLPSWSPLGWEGSCSFQAPSIDIGHVSVKTIHGRKNLSAILPQSGIISVDCPQELYVEVETARFTILSRHSRKDKYIKTQETLAIRYTDNIYVVLDHSGLSIKVEDVHDFKCSLLPSVGERRNIARFLLLQNHGEHYERIGLASLEIVFPWASFIDANKVSEYPDDPEQWKCTIPLGMEFDNRWRNYLKSETIVLG